MALAALATIARIIYTKKVSNDADKAIRGYFMKEVRRNTVSDPNVP